MIDTVVEGDLFLDVCCSGHAWQVCMSLDDEITMNSSVFGFCHNVDICGDDKIGAMTVSDLVYGYERQKMTLASQSPICPSCQYEFLDWYDFSGLDGDNSDIDMFCPRCDTKLKITMYIEASFHTRMSDDN